MSQQELTVEKRAGLGKEACKVMRRQGKLPAVLYGHKETPVTYSVDAKEFSDLVHHHGSHSLITLKGDGNNETAIIKSVQRHPSRGSYSTVDFQRVSATETVTVTLPLILHGEPYEVRTGEGILVQSLHEVEVSALSGGVPESIHVDVSKLVLNGPALHVKDLVLPAGVTVLTPGDEAVAALNGPQVDAEDIALAAEAEAAAEAAAEAGTDAADGASAPATE